MEQMEIGQIHGYALNAKEHPKAQIDQIARSIKEFGFNQPIVVDGNYEIIVGHGRFLAAKQLGLKEVPVLKLDNLTPAQVKAYRLADNKLNESDWNMDLAIEELKELDAAGFDITLTGFEKDLIIESDEKDDQIPDNAPPVAKLGDIWALGRHRLMCGDSTKLEDVEKLMDGKNADMVFTDPPYGINYQTIKAPEKHKVTGDDKLPDIRLLFVFSKPECEKYICIDWRNYPKLVEQIERNGESPKAVIVWNKAGLEERPRLSHVFMKWGFTHEWIVFMGKQGGQKYMFADTLYAKRELPSETHHATAKPISIIIKTLEASSIPEDLIMDLFLGSGSTLIAAEKTNRICYGMEIDPKYCDVIIKRFEDYTGQKATKIN